MIRTTGTDPHGADFGPSRTTGTDAQEVRLLFRYLGGDEWQEYRTILRVFADTFFAEFTPDDVGGPHRNRRGHSARPP